MRRHRANAMPLDGNALRTQRTRNRILAESLRLFNEMGEARVTTGMIATALDMSPGNLYYHFRNKNQIVEQLFRRFEERIDVGPQPAAAGAGAIEDLWLYLHLVLEAIWEYRFLYRSLEDLVGRNRRLREQFARIVERQCKVVAALCEALVRARAMQAGPAQVRTVARNVVLVATYWMSFRALRARPGSHEAELGRGAYQVMSLVEPYLVGEARSHMERLSRSYLE